MSRPTLRNLVDLPSSPSPLSDSTLILVDCQNTYTYGVMELDGVQAALEETAALLDRARTAGIPSRFTMLSMMCSGVSPGWMMRAVRPSAQAEAETKSAVECRS